MALAIAVTTDFSRVARAYRWMEYASFGTLLERTRFLHLPQQRHSRRALILGDGDGRFLQRLLQINPDIKVDSVDFSPGMLRLAQDRVASLAGERVVWHEADAETWSPPEPNYDLIVTHFFLDCLSTRAIHQLAHRLVPCLASGGIWINSDFAVPPCGWMRWPSRVIISSLYAAFFVLAGLRMQSLPEDAAALESTGLVLEHRATLAGGLLKSEVWRKPDSRFI